MFDKCFFRLFDNFLLIYTPSIKCSLKYAKVLWIAKAVRSNVFHIAILESTPAGPTADTAGTSAGKAAGSAAGRGTDG